MIRSCFILPGLLILVACKATAEREPINCTIPVADKSLSRCERVRYASEFSGCLSGNDITEHTCLVMDRNVSFCGSQTSVPITAHFNESGKSLDCKGGSIDHGWGRIKLAQGPATTQAKRSPGIRLVEDVSLSDLTVRNCTIRGTNHMGIKASRFFGGQLGGDGIISGAEKLPVGHRQLRFENLKIEDTITGVFLGNFSADVTLSNVHIDNSQRIALYSEAGSHRIVLTDSIISNNQTREAVAIDSTYDSQISNTVFINNREGAINVYQNCGELKGIVCPVIRSTPSNNNLISNNRFIDNGVSGLQIASRQGRKHSKGWCATLDGERGRFVDNAQHNVITNNTFVCHEGTSLKVHDAPNRISGNTIVARENCVPYEISTGGLSAKYRYVLDGLTFKSNRIDTHRPPRLRNLSTRIAVSDNN
ncbi:MAG: right-handed parallel beta-helix repeat-containing protein [Granulosicoccus sp.]